MTSPSCFCIFLFCSFLCFSSFSLATRVPLTGDAWKITDHQSYSATGHIPGSVHTILLAAKQITEPTWGFNDVNLRPLVYSPWTFSKNFSLADDFLSFQQFTLHFAQIDTVANITLNGCFLGQTSSMFLPYDFNVPRSCLSTENQLRVDFASPVAYALDRARLYNTSVAPDCPPDDQHGECHVQFIRKEPCSFSWDWGPAFAPIGIPGDLDLEGSNPVDVTIELESVNVADYEASKDQWRVDVLLSSRHTPFPAQLRCVLENTSFVYETNTTLSSNISLSLFIPDKHIDLWWPNGYGDQRLYDLSVYNQGTLIGSRRIGFRIIKLIEHDYGSAINGTSFYFLINYQPVFIKGSNWIPSDAFQERVSDEKLERLLRSAQLANMNMLRIWGGGIYERQSFYEIADRLGIMLWHDFMFACSLYPVDEAFLGNVHDEVIYQVKRLQSHSSIVLWSGNNENEAAVAQNWYGIPKEQLAQVKSDYRKLYVETVMKAVQQIDQGSNRPFITSSPTNGLKSVEEDYIATDPNDSLYGDVHFYGYQDDSWDPRTYPITRFLSETGIQSLPSLETWYQATDNATDLNLQSAFLRHREHSGGQIEAMIRHIRSNLPTPVTNDPLQNFTQWIYLSQINQAMTLKSISDHCRLYSSADMIDPKTSQGNTMGLMYWQINDIWQAPTWSTIDYGLNWKMAHYYVRHMYASVYPLAVLTPYLANPLDEQARLSFYVINEFLDDSQGQLTCSVHTLDTFSVRASFSYDVSFDLLIMRLVIDLPYASLMQRTSCSNDTQCLVYCSYNDGQRETDQTLFLTKPKNYQLIQPNLRVERIEQQSSTHFSITLTATRPALFVWLEIPANVSGYFSKNGFHMFAPTTVVDFHSWTPINDVAIRLRSLFDVTQP